MSVNTSVSHKNFGKHVASEIMSISLLPLSPIHHSNGLPRPFENVQTVDFCLMSNSNSTFVTNYTQESLNTTRNLSPGTPDSYSFD